MRAVLKHVTAELPDQIVEFTVDRKLRTVHLNTMAFDPHLIGRFVVKELPRRARGVVAHSVAAFAKESGARPAPYRVVVAFAGLEFDSEVIELEGGGVDVILFSPSRDATDPPIQAQRPDLVDAATAARMAGVKVTQLLAWTRAKRPRVIGLDLGMGLRFPRWQFEPLLWRVVPQLARALDGNAFTVVTWLETPLGAFEGLSPRQAIERGESPERVLGVAYAAE